MIKAILFDLGGTLIDYTGQHTQWPQLETPGFAAAYKVLTQTAGKSSPTFSHFLNTGFAHLPQRWEAAIQGQQNLQLAHLLQEVWHLCGGEDAGNPVLFQEAATQYEDAICAHARPITGSADLLNTLQKEGYKLGLLSNTMFQPRAHRRDLQKFGLDHYFDTFLFSAQSNKWKPTPAPYWHLLEQLHVPAHEAIFVGDSLLHDVVGAHNAGIKAIHFPTHTNTSTFPHIQPDATLQQLTDLPHILKTQF